MVVAKAVVDDEVTASDWTEWATGGAIDDEDPAARRGRSSAFAPSAYLAEAYVIRKTRATFAADVCF